MFAADIGNNIVEGILKESAVQAGVDLQIDIKDKTASWKMAQEKKHEIFLGAFNTSIEMYPRYWDFWHSSNAYKDSNFEQLKPQTNNLTSTADPKVDVWVDQYRDSVDKVEIKRLAFKMEEWLYDDAAFIPGWVQPFYRVGHWRWVRFPDDFNNKLTSDYDVTAIFWIDEQIKKETLEAMKSGKTFPKTLKEYKKYQAK